MKSPNDTFAVLAPNLVVSGNLLSEGNIHVDGTVEGDVQTVHLTIGSTGNVKGRVYGKEVKVSGRVQGSITACELILEETAVIEGDVHYQSLSVSRGARVNGQCQYSDTDLNITALSGPKSGKVTEEVLTFGETDKPTQVKSESRQNSQKAGS